MIKVKSVCVFALILMTVSIPSFASFRCGNWLLAVNGNGETMLNKQITDTQKLTFLSAQGDYNQMKVEMSSCLPVTDSCTALNS